MASWWMLQAAYLAAGARQQVLANNIANAEVPGYQRQDLRFDPQSLSQSSFAAQLDRFAGSAPAGVPLSVATLEQEHLLQRNAGGGVDLSFELQQIVQNGLRYQTLASLVAQRYQEVAAVLGAAR
ncbi:MAG: hypothetical protein IMW91_00125 [Firmicutes bacterium]|nr:hypothetical protein [Bacillota bacterium]